MKEKTKKFKKSGLYNFLFDRRFILISMLGSVVLSILVAYCYNLIPFGNKTILRMDLYHQYGPLFAELYERVKGGESLLYSWTSGGGSCFLGNFFNYLSSPLSLLIFLFPHKYIPVAIGIIIFTKATLSSATFTVYLKKSLNQHNYMTAGFGILYAFSGYFIAYYWNVMWLDAMVLLPVLLYGIEKIITKAKPLTFTAALALIMISNYYMSYMACIFSVIYFCYYYFSYYNFGDKIGDYRLPLNKLKHKKDYSKITHSRFLNAGVIFGCAAICAALIAAVSLIPTYFILNTCSATSDKFPESYTIYYSLFDFIANHFAGVEPTIRSSGEDVLPNVYCGVLTAMLLPMYYLTKSIKIREKVSTTAILVFLFFSFNTNYLNFIWHGFHFPNDLPYRFSYMYSFIILITAYKTIIRIREFKPKEIMILGFSALAFLVITEKTGSKNVTDFTVSLGLFLIIIYTFVLYLLMSKKYNRQAVTLLVLCCFISEYAVANSSKYVMNQNLDNYAGDYYDFVEAKEIADKDHNSDNIYRMEMTDYNAIMSPCWYNYNGISCFSSMAYEKVSNLQQNLGLYGNFINSYSYYLQTPIYNAMFSLDYIFNNNENIDMNRELFDMLGGNDSFTVYKNKYTLPIGYMTDKSIKDWDSTSYNPFEVQEDLFKKATGIGDIFSHVDIYDISGYNAEDISGLGEDENFLYFTPAGDEGEITVLIKPEKSENLYLYISSDELDCLTVENCGKEITQDLDDEHYIFDLGMCAKGEIVTLRMTVKEDADPDGYADFILNSVNMDNFIKGYNILKDRSMKVEEFSDTVIKGSVTSADDGILFTTVPYDEGWKVTVDGKAVDSSQKLRLGDALLGINLTKGTHNIEMKYEPKGLKISICLSIAGIIIFISYILFIRKLKFVRKIRMCFDELQEPELLAEIKEETERQNEFIRLTEEMNSSEEELTSEQDEMTDEEE